MGKNLEKLAPIAAIVNSLLMVFAFSRISDDVNIYVSAGAATFVLTLFFVPVFGRKLRRAKHKLPAVTLLTLVIFSPLAFNIYVNFETFPFGQTTFAITMAVAFFTVIIISRWK